MAAALMENNAKRILAYPHQIIGLRYLGLVSMNAIGITGGLIFLLAHSLAKAGLFRAGIIEHKTHTRDRAAGDAAHHAHHGITFILCMTIVGFPPTAGFGGADDLHGIDAKRQDPVCDRRGAGRIPTVIYMLRMFNAVSWVRLKGTVKARR
jgi:NADH:ubiquinone oxidoreductase subunit 4 (subunit M)